MIAAHAAALAPERVEAIVLSDPYFPALRHLEDVSRWGHWQNFRREAAEAGVMLSDEHWYDLGKFFDQVLHLDDASMLPGSAGPSACRRLNRLLRLGRTTCGDDSKADAGLTAERIAAIAAPALALYGEASPFLATAEYLVDHLPDCRRVLVPGAQHRAPEENPEAFLAAIARLPRLARPGREGGPMSRRGDRRDRPVPARPTASAGRRRSRLAIAGYRLGLIDRDGRRAGGGRGRHRGDGAAIVASRWPT